MHKCTINGRPAPHPSPMRSVHSSEQRLFRYLFPPYRRLHPLLSCFPFLFLPSHCKTQRSLTASQPTFAPPPPPLNHFLRKSSSTPVIRLNITTQFFCCKRRRRVCVRVVRLVYRSRQKTSLRNQQDNRRASTRKGNPLGPGQLGLGSSPRTRISFSEQGETARTGRRRKGLAYHPQT
jgi:hypothetical protein